MTREELREKRNQTIENLNYIKATLGLDELYIDELEKENAELKEKLNAIDKAGEQVRQQINDTFRNKPSYADLKKENAELKLKLEVLNEQTPWKDIKDKSEVIRKLTEAKAIMNIAIEGIKYWGIVGGNERPLEKQAERLFNLFLDKAEQFISEVEK